MLSRQGVNIKLLSLDRMDRLRELYEICKNKGLVEKAEYLLNNLDDTLRFNCKGCNSNVFEHDCLVEGTVVEKLKSNRYILTHTSIDTEIDSIFGVALFLTKHSEKLSDIRDIYDFEDIENPDVNFSPPSSPESLPDIVQIDDSDNELSPPNRPTTSNFPIPLQQQKSKFGKMLSSKRGKAQQRLVLGIPYCTTSKTKSKNEHSFKSLGQKLNQLTIEYQELLLKEEFVLDNNIREKHAIELVISRLNQCEDVHTSIQLKHDSDERLKRECQEKENQLKLEYEDKLNQTKRTLEDALICSICLENKKSKTLVPCGHSFCLPCLNKLSKLSEDSEIGKKCSICRRGYRRKIPMYC